VAVPLLVSIDCGMCLAIIEVVQRFGPTACLCLVPQSCAGLGWNRAVIFLCTRKLTRCTGAQLLAVIVLLRCHPRPVRHTPSFADSTAFVAVAFGAAAGLCRAYGRILFLGPVWGSLQAQGGAWAVLRRLGIGALLKPTHNLICNCNTSLARSVQGISCSRLAGALGSQCLPPRAAVPRWSLLDCGLTSDVH